MSVQLFAVDIQGGTDTLAPRKSEEWKAMYKWPSPMSHPGGHAEPETEHERELLDYLHFRLRSAKGQCEALSEQAADAS